jgi:hypothetical protein
MKRLIIALLVCAATGSAHAQQPTTPRSPTCTNESIDKKLAGAAKTSFMKKCETDATAACDAAATDEKLSGAAKTSFTKKCVSVSVGG